MYKALVLMLLFGCDVQTTTAQTWADVSSDWGQSWCDWTERCYPNEYAQFASHDDCVAFVVAVNCEPFRHDCAALYSHEQSMMDSCLADMSDWTCGTVDVPTVCHLAMRR